MRLPRDEEGRAPVLSVILRELKIPSPPRHTAHHVADPGLRTEPAVK